VSEDRDPQPEWEVSGVDEDGAERIIRDFHDLYCQSRDRTWMNTFWLGVGVIKCPPDLWVYQEILFRLRPDVIIETGTDRGGSAYFMATMCDLIGPGRIITIDIGTVPDRPRHPRITYLLGSSVDADILEAVNKSISPDEKVMVVLDSNHNRDHVFEEMHNYAPLVSEGSYMIVEDSNINSWRPEARRRPGPLEAIKDFLAEDDRFEIDRSWEKFFVTFNPSGYLRRRSTSG
jgi:cephalosporin hydroxylase